MGRRVGRTFGCLAWVLAAAVVFGSGSAHANGASETRLAALTNSSRVEAGVGSLERDGDLDDVARRHSLAMAERGGEPWHNAELSAELSGWEELGEIVGAIDADPDWEERVHGSFLRSTRHRDEIVRPAYTEVGIGVAYSESEDRYYVTEVFRRPNRPAVHPQATEARPVPPAPTVDAPPPTTTLAPAEQTGAGPVVRPPSPDVPGTRPPPPAAAAGRAPSGAGAIAAPDPLATELASAQTMPAPASGLPPAVLGSIPLTIAAMPAVRRLRARRTRATSVGDRAGDVDVTDPPADRAATVGLPPRPVARAWAGTSLDQVANVGASEWERLRRQLDHAWAEIGDECSLTGTQWTGTR